MKIQITKFYDDEILIQLWFKYCKNKYNICLFKWFPQTQLSGITKVVAIDKYIDFYDKEKIFRNY